MAVFKVYINVPNIANTISLYDEIQIWRSEVGVGGPYSELTAAAAAAATLLAPTAGPYNLNGLTLLLEVDGGTEDTITFVSADPISADDVADLINAEAIGVTAVEEGGAVRITSDEIGTDSILEITGGTSLTEFGWIVGDKDTGEDARVLLVAGTSAYTYDDQSGDDAYYYKTRFYNSVSGDVSPFSDPPVQGNVGAIIDGAQLILAKIDLATVNGNPVTERRITFHPVYLPVGFIVDSKGVVRGDVEVYTDAVGHAETLLVKGAIVDVSISGTGITRRITVPTAGSEFDVLGEIAAADDVFQIQIPDIPAAVRRT